MLQTERYQMKEVCEQVGITYETLKYYCNEGLVPNHERDENNYRIFDDNDVGWINGLFKLRACGMSIKDMKKYMELCFEGKSSIEERKEMLEVTRKELEAEIARVKESLEYIDKKKQYYNQVLAGEIELTSNLIK
ncbi:MAG TPA: MerR family transcriptional regulator [Atopostipes sp.]|nr:MerR family transcriptional regulator [Atopostipes sp.]